MKYDFIGGLSPAEVRDAGATPEVAADALIQWEREHGSMFVEPTEIDRQKLIDEVTRFAFRPVAVGVAAQQLLEATVGNVTVMVHNKNGRWLAGPRGTSPTTDVTNVIHDTDGLTEQLRRVVEAAETAALINRHEPGTV